MKPHGLLQLGSRVKVVDPVQNYDPGTVISGKIKKIQGLKCWVKFDDGSYDDDPDFYFSMVEVRDNAYVVPITTQKRIKA